ncbi:MAG: methyl-accepting chemotaxis protein [Anaerolineae bacterium]
MKISTRLTIALLVAALVPVILLGAWSVLTLRHAGDLALEESKATLAEAGEEMIHQRARGVAHEIALYLNAHPELDPTDGAALEADTTLAAIAVQRSGARDYTAVFDDRGVTHFHSNPQVVGMDMSTKAESLPDFWRILSASLEGEASWGYYPWEDADKVIRDKFMYIVPVEGTPLRVAATTYVEEFERPLARIEERLNGIWGGVYAQLAGALLVVSLAAVGGSLLFSRQICRPIQQLVDTTGQIASGDLTVQPPRTRAAEMALLANSFGEMTTNLSALIRQVRAMSVSVGGAAGEVVTTQRHHAGNAEEQAAAVNSASSAVQELASSSAEIAATGQAMIDVAGQTQANAQQGVESMKEAARRLERIAASNQAAATQVHELAGLAEQIGGVMDLIEEVAAQTKLIAFNASIEAASAGAAGRRFAVVAAQVRRLADRVAQSTDQIRTSVGEDLAQRLERILSSAEQTTLAVHQISLGTHEQQEATEHLQSELEPVTVGAQAIAMGSKETVSVMEDLVAQAQDLEKLTHRFKLPGTVE